MALSSSRTVGLVIHHGFDPSQDKYRIRCRDIYIYIGIYIYRDIYIGIYIYISIYLYIYRDVYIYIHMWDIYIYIYIWIYIGYISPYSHAEHIPFHMATFIQVLTESHMRNFD